jgi:thymidylate kinase
MPRRRRGRIVAIEGASAAGKTTVSAGLAALGWSVVLEAFDRLDRAPDLAVPTPDALRTVERRLVREEERRSREALRRRARGEDVILDTATVGPATYSLGLAQLDPRYASVADSILHDVRERLHDGRLAVPERVVYLVVAEPTRRRRIAKSPLRHPITEAARHAAVGRSEYRFWRAVARRSPDTVRFVEGSVAPARVLRLVERAVARPGPRLSKRAVLDVLDARFASGKRPPDAVASSATPRRRHR